MKKGYCFLLLSGFVACSLLGCSLVPSTANTSSNDFRLEYEQFQGGISLLSGPVTITRAEIIVKGSELVVAGTLQRAHQVHLPGSVHLVVLSPEGEMLWDKRQRVSGLMSHRSGMLNVPFRIRLGRLPPKGAVIRIRYRGPGSA
jgi:hypothetical protein